MVTHVRSRAVLSLVMLLLLVFSVAAVAGARFLTGRYVRRVSTDGTINTIAGGGKQVPGDGGPGTQALLGIVNGVALDNAGNLYFCEANRIRKLTPAGTISTYAGTGANGFNSFGYRRSFQL